MEINILWYSSEEGTSIFFIKVPFPRSHILTLWLMIAAHFSLLQKKHFWFKTLSSVDPSFVLTRWRSRQLSICQTYRKPSAQPKLIYKKPNYKITSSGPTSKFIGIALVTILLIINLNVSVKCPIMCGIDSSDPEECEESSTSWNRYHSNNFKSYKRRYM